MVALSHHLDDCLRMINVGKLSRIELWRESIESISMYGFELRGIDAPLIRCDLQSREHGGQVTIDMPSLVATDDTAGPVN